MSFKSLTKLSSVRFSDLLFSLVVCTFIGYFNFLVIKYFFIGEFNQNVSSIEISYIQMAKFWVEGGGLWQPLWYLGYPWHVFYTPILPFFEVLLHGVLGFSFAHAYRVIAGSGYILAPISLYLFVWQISKSKTGGLVAALSYSFLPSILALLFEEVRNDSLSGLVEPRRFTNLARWGEGPHTLALVFVPIFGFFLSKFIEEKKQKYLISASLFLVLSALTNAVALWAALLMFFAFFLAEICRGELELVPLVKMFGKVALVAFGLGAFWYNLPFVSTFFKESGGSFSNWVNLLPWGLVVLLFVSGLLIIFVKKLAGKVSGLPFSIFWFLTLFPIVFVYYSSGDLRLEYAPQALRLNTEVDMAFAVLAGVVVSSVFLFFKKREKAKAAFNLLGYVLVSAAVLPIVLWSIKLTRKLPEFTKPLSMVSPAGIEGTAEYKSAKEFEKLVGRSGERVLAPGNYGFWLDYFTNVPQIRGALSQSSTNHWPDHIYYQVVNGQDAQISLAWLKIANVGKFLYTTDASKEPYKDFKVPRDKFDSTLRVIEEKNGDIYYDVPLGNSSPAKVVEREAIAGLKVPKNAIDSAPIYAYLDWLEKYSGNKVLVEKLASSRYRIKGNIGAGQAVSFSQTYDLGWQVIGGGWDVRKDAFGFMVLVPKSAGDFNIELSYRRPVGVYLGYLITVLTVLVLAKGSMLRNRLLKKAD